MLEAKHSQTRSEMKKTYESCTNAAVTSEWTLRKLKNNPWIVMVVPVSCQAKIFKKESHSVCFQVHLDPINTPCTVCISRINLQRLSPQPVLTQQKTVSGTAWVFTFARCPEKSKTLRTFNYIPLFWCF